MKKFNLSGVFDGWRIDTAIIKATNEKSAKEKFRKQYKNKKSITSIIIGLSMKATQKKNRGTLAKV